MNRSSVRGFAAGLLVACIVFGSYYYGNKPKEQEEEKPLTLNEIQAASEQLGYMVVKKTDKKTKEQSKTEPIAYTLIIKEGMSSEDIGKLLKTQNIIKEVFPFSDYLNKHQLTTKIQIGEFPLNSTMTIEEIVSIITKASSKST